MPTPDQRTARDYARHLLELSKMQPPLPREGEVYHDDRLDAFADVITALITARDRKLTDFAAKVRGLVGCGNYDEPYYCGTLGKLCENCQRLKQLTAEALGTDGK